VARVIAGRDLAQAESRTSLLSDGLCPSSGRASAIRPWSVRLTMAWEAADGPADPGEAFESDLSATLARRTRS